MSARAAKTQMKAFGIGGKTNFFTRSRPDKKRKPSPNFMGEAQSLRLQDHFGANIHRSRHTSKMVWWCTAYDEKEHV